MKKRIVNSWLFKSTDVFYPGGTPPTGFVQLPSSSVKTLQREVNGVLNGLAIVSDAVRPRASKYFGANVQPARPINLYLVSRDEAVAHSSVVRGSLEIELDVRVLQALLRASLAASFGKAADSDDQRVAEFLKLKAEVKGASAGSGFRDAFFDKSDRWFAMVDLDRKSESVRGDYLGTLMFLLSHEVGHYVLGHHSQACDVNACESFQKRELAADRYATYMLSHYLGLFASEFGYTTGVDTFFHYGYERIGFKDSMAAGCGCIYPMVADRIAAAKESEEAAREELSQELQAEILRQLSGARRGGGGLQGR